MPQWLRDFGNWILDMLKTLAYTLLTMIKDALMFIFEQLMLLIIFLLDALGDLFSALDITQYIAGIPPDMAWVLQQIGLGQAISMIIIAITIRIMLQLIPFTRLGS
ncbi:DUF2523 family protein [Alkalimonas sp. NCh-2]|uniref:DUF2523 family protein n=1 Tax=Alkalimonas sp. NCh-2 TaxID=3144846 RepID=UPI0031F695E4